MLETLPAGTFRVRFPNGYEILAHLSGKMRLNRISLLPGDKVIIEMSPYDLTKGRVTEEYNDNFMKVRASVKKSVRNAR